MQAHYQQGTRLCEWLYEGTCDGRPVGHLLIEAMDISTVTVSFGFRGFAHLFPAEGSQAFAILQRDRGRSVFVCPRCAAPRSKLFMVRREWGCRACHELTNRSSREGSLFRLHLEKARLSALLANGRPKRMRQRTHDKMLMRLEEVTAMIAGRPAPPPNERLGYVIQVRWTSWCAGDEDPARRWSLD